MKAKKVVSVLCGVSLLAAPIMNSSAASEPSPAAAEQVQSTEKLLSSAMSEYRSNDRTLSDATIKEIMRQKESVLPIVRKGILMEANRLRFPIADSDALYDEWSFWLEVARQLHDERLLPDLLHWTDDRRSIPNPFRLGEVIDGVLPAGKEGTLLPLLDKATEEGAEVLLSLYAKRVQVSAQQIRDWLTNYAKSPSIGGIVSVIAGLPDGQEQLKQQFGKTPGAHELDRAIIGRIDYGKDRKWASEVAKATEDAYIEQTIDLTLAYHHGDPDAVKRLYESGEKGGYQVLLTGPVEKLIVARYPDGMLAKGIKQYEAITGKPYFFGGENEEWYRAKGADYDKPQAGITQWQAFIRAYPNHPAADDAAYRLARCYQIAGQYDQALIWFERALTSGDADMWYDASGQFLFVLDVNTGQDGFAKLEKTEMPEWKQIWVAYSKAVETLRANQFEQAARELQNLITRYDGKEIFADSVLQYVWYDRMAGDTFWYHVKQQLASVRKLASLQEAANQAEGADRARKQYELAAAIFHDEFTYYNYLWHGERQTFFWIGQIREMEYDESLDRYIGRFNHLVQAKRQFDLIQFDQADPETGAKALFSRALCDSKLTQYGQEVSFHSTRAALLTDLVDTGEQLLKRYPDSELADDMLLLMYRYNNDDALIQRLLTHYPKSDSAAEAKKLQSEKNTTAGGQQQPSPFLSRLPYQQLSQDDWKLPATVAKWYAEKKTSDKLMEAVIEESGWTYFAIKTEKGKVPTISGLEVDHNNTYVYYWLSDPSKTNVRSDQDCVLIRVPTRFLPKGEIHFRLA
ncbi:UNVERIFIED_CONTAM: TolA-binding protein [Brevibacillus sp. OAP136]